MELTAGSVICQFFLLLGQAAGKIYRHSVLARVVNGWRYSALVRLACAVAEAWKAWWRDSALAEFFCRREGLLPRAWPRSVSCQLLSLLINLPTAVLHWLYLTLKPWFTHSFFAQLAFGMGEQVPAAAGWLMLAIMNVDYDRWSNSYALMGYVLVLLLAIAGGMRRRALRLDAAGIGPYVALFFAAVCLSWPLSQYPGLSARYLYYHVTCALCVLAVVSTVERSGQLERLAAFGCLGMTGAAAFGVYQRIQGVEVIRAYVDLNLNADMPGRVNSFYENPNAFAEMLVFLIPVAAALLIGSRRRLYRLIGLVCAALGCAVLIMTYSRASWVGLAVAGVAFVYLWNRKLLPLCMVAAVAVLPLLPDVIFNRILTIFNPNDSSASSRGPLMEAGVRALKVHPILGAGLGGDAVRKLVAELQACRGNAPFTHTHNVYLQVWLEHGLLGLTAFVAAMFNLLKQGAKTAFLPRCGRSTRMIVLGATAALAGSLVSGLADYLFTYPRVMLIFWYVLSLLLAGAKLARRERV